MFHYQKYYLLKEVSVSFVWLYFGYWMTWNAIPNKYRSERIVLVGNKGLLGWTRKWIASLAERERLWAGMRDEFCKALGNPQVGRPPLALDYLPSVSGQDLCEMGSPLYVVSATPSWSLLSSSTEAPLSLVHPCRQSVYSRTVVTPDPLDSPTQPMSSESPQESASVPITVHQVAAKSERRQERWVGRFIYTVTV